MSDLFNHNQNTIKSNVNENSPAFNQRINEYKQQKQQAWEYYDRYGVDVPQEYYDIFNQVISKAETPELAQEEAYRLGSAVKYSELMGESIWDSYKNVDAYNKANFPNLQNQKGWYEALTDYITLGNNNVKLGNLGQQLMKAHRENDTELADKLMQEIDAINQRNYVLQDHVPDKWWKEATEAGAVSAPFSGYVAGAGIIGNFIAPGVGTFATFTASSYLSAGQEYIDMLANGSKPETARTIAIASGMIQGLIEANLGITSSIVKGSAKAMGKEVAEDFAKKKVEEIGRKVFKRFHFGSGKKLLANWIENYVGDIAGEGFEELFQEVTSITGQEIAASLDGYDIPDDDIKSITNQILDAFKGGLLGAITLGIGSSGLNAAVDVKEYSKLRNRAETVQSPEQFYNEEKDNPIFDGMTEESKRKVLHDIHEQGQLRVEERLTTEAKQIAEGLDAAEGAEERKVTVDENGEEVTEEAEPIARDEKGRLFVQDEAYKDDNGKVTGGIYVTGDANVSGKEEGNRYGYIKYSQDENGDITIDTFKMAEGRDGLRQEFFDQFAQEHPDVKIEWNAIGSDTQAIKQQLINENPSGAKNGLSYYTTEELNSPNNAARKMVARELRNNIHNVEKVVDQNGNVTYKRTQLTSKQEAAGITLIESAARRMGMGLAEYIQKTFGDRIFGAQEEFISSTLAQGEKIEDKAGGMRQGVAQVGWKQIGQEIKAVIYAGENADFSTWAHEMAHVFQNQLDGELKTEAENAFNVQNGDWINSKYTFSDGREMSSAEAFAYGFQDWLETGKAENQQMQNIFQKFAQFIADCYNKLKNHLNFTPEIESVFNKLLDGDDTIMSKALKAAREEENEYRANLKRQAQEAETAKKTAAEEEQKQAELEKEEASETTDFVEKSQEMTVEQAEKQLEETNVKETGNAIDDALENLNISDEQKAETAEVLKDETSTIVEKADAIADAAGEQFDLFQRQERILNQLVGEPSIRRMVEGEERTRILADLKKAKKMDQRFKSMDAESKASRIRMITGWEKDANGKWKYETDDSVNFIKGGTVFDTWMRASPQKLIEASEKANLNLGDIYDAPELYKIFPYMKNVRVSFYSDPAGLRSAITPQGIKVNIDGMYGVDGAKGLKASLVHEIQHVIQAMEYGENKALQGVDLEQLYNDMKDAIQAAGHNNTEYDITSLVQGVKTYMETEGEIEARNVARRVMMNADQRRNKTIASTEDVERTKLLYQDVADLQEAQEKATELIQQDEIEYVRAQYENTDQYLKAPNGQDTNLTEKQWLQVRTPSFKNWFGDWENDPANASKVVDENGEPLVVYHGTTEDFDVFDATKSRANMDIQGNFFSPWDIDAQGYGPNVRAFFLNIKNPADSSTGYKALNTYKGQNEAGVKARELLINQGYDGVNNDNEEYIAFKSNQIKSATDNNGDFDANNDNILFQTTPKEQEAADAYLDTFKSAEKKRIKSNLEKFKDTPWYNSTIKSLNIRNEINDLLDGKEIAADSTLKKDIVKTYYEILTDGDTKQERIEHLYEYFECDSSLIGHPTKPINAVASSFINCNPSKECAKFCYAANGRNKMINLIANRELVNWCIEHDPVRSAKMVADEYKDTREYKNGVALRLLDTGDLSAPWLDFIKELNDRGIACQIFSKRPDLLKQVDKQKNVILLSIDNSNTDVAAKNPDMPIAYVYSGAQDLEYIKNSEERFKQYGGVVLPVVMNHRYLNKNEVNQLPDWSKKYTCPIDAGWKKIGNSKKRKYNTDNWNCSVCDINGQGCFFARAVKDREKFYATLKEVPIGVLNAITEEYERFARSKLAALGLPESEIGSILAEMVNIRDQKLAGIDTEGTGRGSDSIRTTLPSAPGKAESQKGKNGSKKETGTEIKYQQVADASQSMQLAVESTYDGYANEQTEQKAESILDTKIKEISNDNRRSPKVYSIFKDLKQHKGAEIVGKQIEVDTSARPTETGWNQLREILDIFRNKSFETFRYVLVDQNGEIKKQYAVTAKVPSRSNISAGATKEEQIDYINQIANEAVETGCRIVFVHNHPSGKVDASEEDINVTNFLRQAPSIYLGHMILDHNSYNLNVQSDADGSVWNQHEIKINDKDNLVKTPRKYKDVLNKEIRTPLDLDIIAVEVNEVEKGTVAVCFTNAASKITSLAYIPEELFTVENLQQLRENLEDTALKSGTNYTFAITDNADIVKFINENNKVLRFGDISSYSKEKSGYVHLNADNLRFYNFDNIVGQRTLFQKVFHGSGASFDKFDTENFGLSGEGSMRFGYGTYVTDSEEIARDYAERQAIKDQTLDHRYFVNTINEKIKDGLSFEDAKKQLKEEVKQVRRLDDTDSTLKEIDDITEDDLTDKGKHNLYTVEIPDNGYISWDSPLNKDVIEAVNKGLRDLEAQKKFYSNVELSAGYNTWNEQYKEFTEHPERFIGEDLYIYLSAVLHGREKASRFLNSIGFAGIKYLAGQIHGNGNGAYNYVIFNDDDAKIVDHLLYQTNAELMAEAQTFDSWQEFMDYCETFHVDVDEVSPIPSEADAQWYQSYWETAHGLVTEQEKNEQAVKEKAKKDGTVPQALDALFTTYIRQNPEMLDDFLHEVARIDAIDLDSDEWRNVADEEDAMQRDKIDTLKDAITITLSDYNWQSAMRRIQGGGEISEGMRKRLMGEMTDTMKSRDFRALYAEVMEDPQYAVDEEDTTSAMLAKKLQKYQQRYYDIVKPGEDISKMSPEKRKQIAEAMANRDIANKIRNGSLKLDDELNNYIKSLDRQIKEKQKQFDELERETKADYQRIADTEKRRLLKLHDELLIAKSKVTQKNSDTARKINKGLKITEKYRRESQNLQANYDELFRKFNDLKNTIQITAEVQAALDRQEQVANVREDLNAKQKEKNLTNEVKKMRIQLVKKTMRRVPFNRIDYENAKTIIAIQRMLEPNLIGGVNKFIGIDSPFLRGVISQFVTDSEYRQELLDYLNTYSRSSEAFMNFKKKLSELKSIKDFDSWTAKDRKAALRYLPKENWIRDLNLKQLAKERDESIDLDIDTEEYSRPVYDENGKPKTYKDAEGIEHNVKETAFRLRYSDELGQLVKDAVGADMFDRIINRPFSEWTTEELEQLAQRIDELYTEGRDLLAAKNEAKRREAEAIRKRVEDAIKETGIVINDDDPPEEKERKQKKINKILNLNSGLKGTEAGKDKGIKAKLDRLIHGYSDMNMLRFARTLDNQSEGENVYMLYRREDECYNAKTRSINNRARAINEIMKANKITEGDLAKSIKVPSLNTEFTVDELLYFLAADKDYVDDEKKLAKGLVGLEANDDWAATSRNAVMFGNMMSDSLSQEQKEKWVELDKEMELAIKNDTLTAEQKQLKELGQLETRPGTSAYISYCHAAWAQALSAANSFIAEHPEYVALMEAIEADYASQYERMNEVSINEFNMPVHRVRAYVPLVRRESNGDTNVNQVKEDLLGAYGADAGKQWVNKGMTQRRVQMNPLHQKPVQTGLFATWGSSVERTEHFIAYAPYVRQLNAVYKSRDAAYTRRFIEARYGKNAVKYIDDYINEVANPNAGKIREAGSEFLHTLRGRTAPAYLGWKFSAIIKQGLTSPWPYMQFVNPAEYAAAALECTRKGTYDAIKEKSVFMHNRVMDPMNELIEEMAEEGKTKFDRAVGKFGKKGMAGLEWIDWVCVAPGWLACYKKEYARLQRASDARYEAKMEELRERNMYADIGTSLYMTPEQMEAQAQKEILEDIETEAVRYADDCTRQCQPSSRAADLAPLFKNSSEAMKAFLQFQTSLNVIWQNIRYDMPYAVRNKQFNRIVGTILGYVFAGIFMNSVMDGVTSGADDDDDKEKQALRNLIFYSTTQFTDAVPIMGSELTNMFDQVITGKRGFANSGTDMTPSATKMLSAFTNASKGNWKKAATLSAEAIGMGLGAPVSGIKEINKLLGKPLDEGDVDLLRGLGDVYGIAGDFIEE